MRKRRTHGGFSLSILNPFTWFRKNTPNVPLEEVVVNNQKPVEPAPVAPNTVVEVKPPAPEGIRVIGEANAQGIPPTPPPGTPGFKVEGGRRRSVRRRRSARRKSSKRSVRRRSTKRKH
jgi:hypothetical protein